MKVETPQIIWHSKDSKFADRVYSLDFQPGTSRLATAGADEFIHIWEITREAEWKLKILSRLFGHEKEVNCVRFSSTGELLASGGQDDSLCIWKPTNEKQQVVFGQNSEDVLGFPEYWKRITIMRCMAPVVSLSWSPDDSKVVVGTEDDRVTIWNVHTGKLLRQLDGHSHMVMGVSWDPKDQFIASQSSDQTVRLWKSKTAKTKKKTGLILKSNQKKEVGEELTSGLVDEEKTAEEVGKAREETGKETTDNVADQAAEIVQKDTIDTVTDLTIVSNCSVTDNDVNMEVDDKQNHGLSKNENKNLKSDIKSWKLHHTIKYEALESNLRNKQQTRFEVENLENQELVIGDCATPNNIKLSNSNSSSNGGQKRRCLFLAESATTTFFRRLDWSPNGEILVVPTGQYFINTQSGEHRKSASMDGNSKDLGGSNQVLMPVSYVFLREEYSYPAAVLPSPDGTTSSIRFNQVAFLPLSNEIENNKENPSLNQQNSFSSYRTTPKDNQESWIFLNKSKTNEIMPRYIFSVITLAGTIYIYDTQHIHPIVAIRGLHFQGMNDASWSSDGHTLAVASSDGYITIVFFENGELGQVLKTPVVPKSSTTETPHQSKDHCECKDTDVPDTLSLPISNLNPVDIRRGTGGEKEEEIYRGVENDNSNKIQTINLECNKSNQDEDSNTKYNDNAAPKIKRRINPTVLISYE